MIQQQHQDTTEHVVTLHGLGRSARIMKRMGDHLQAQGFVVHNIGYPSTRYSIEQLADQYLHRALQRPELLSATKIHFVGHSLGSILLRYYLQHQAIPNIGRTVMIAPPNQGSELAEFLQRFAFYKYLTGPAGQQLGLGEASVPKKIGSFPAEFAVIAGKRNFNFFFRCIMPSPSDGKVSVQNAQLPGMKDFLVVPCGHAFIVNNRSVIQQTAHFLRDGKFIRS